MFEPRKWDMDKIVATLRKTPGFSGFSYGLRVIWHFHARNAIKNNMHLKDKHLGESCFILGNGITLSEMSPADLNKKVVFACNEIFYYPEFSSINISYFTISEPYYSFIWSKNYKDQTRDLYESVDQAFDVTATKFIFHSSLKKYFSKNRFFRNRDVTYFSGAKRIQDDGARYDLSSEFSFGKGALPTMIGAALFMGFKEIHLVGCGYTFSPMQLYHFWTRPSVDSAEFDREQAERHFKKFAETEVDSAHDTELYEVQEENGAWLPVFTQKYRVNPIYEKLKAEAERKGVKIFNMLPRRGEYTSPVFPVSDFR